MLFTLGTMLIAGHSAAKKNEMADDSREKSLSEGRLYYFDGDSRKRHVHTHEYVTIDPNDHSCKGHTTLRGLKTKTIYKDYTEEAARISDEELMKAGYSFRYRELMTQTDLGYPASNWFPYDPKWGFYKLNVNYSTLGNRYYVDIYRAEPGYLGHLELRHKSENISKEEYERLGGIKAETWMSCNKFTVKYVKI